MIIGKSITSSLKGLTPQIIVTAPTGSTVTCDGVAGTEVSGTWTFNVGLGSHTIVATLGEDSQTETVLVSEIAQYSVVIDYKTYLYNQGDERTSLTGGWITYTNGQTVTLTKNSDNMYIVGSGDGSGNGIQITNNVDLTNYTRIYVDSSWNITSAASSSNASCAFKIGSTEYPLQKGLITASRAERYIDISSLTGSYNIKYECYYTKNWNSYVYKIWLE